jgi:hypothetical protein
MDFVGHKWTVNLRSFLSGLNKKRFNCTANIRILTVNPCCDNIKKLAEDDSFS